MACAIRKRYEDSDVCVCVVSWLCLAIALCFLLSLLCFFDFGVVVEGGGYY